MATMSPQDLSFADTAPIVVEAGVTVSGTPEEVWGVILDYERWPTWFSGVKTCRATSDPATGLGSTREVTLGGGTRVSERFIAWDEPRVWAFTATEAPPVITALVERVTIAPVDGHRTLVTYRMAFAPRWGLRWLVSAARSQIRANLARSLGNLDGEMARRRAGPPD